MKYLLLIALAFSSLGCFTVKSNDHFYYEKVEPERYAQMLQDSGDYYLIDVRTRKEHENATIAHAMNFNFLAFHFGRDVDSLQRDKLVFMYCYTCHRSPFAARIMKRKGFRKVYDLAGGFQRWQKVINHKE